MLCPRCGRINQDYAEECFHCQCSFNEKTTRKNTKNIPNGPFQKPKTQIPPMPEIPKVTIPQSPFYSPVSTDLKKTQDPEKQVVKAVFNIDLSATTSTPNKKISSITLPYDLQHKIEEYERKTAVVTNKNLQDSKKQIPVAKAVHHSKLQTEKNKFVPSNSFQQVEPDQDMLFASPEINMTKDIKETIIPKKTEKIKEQEEPSLRNSTINPKKLSPPQKEILNDNDDWEFEEDPFLVVSEDPYEHNVENINAKQSAFKIRTENRQRKKSKSPQEKETTFNFTPEVKIEASPLRATKRARKGRKLWIPQYIEDIITGKYDAKNDPRYYASYAKRIWSMILDIFYFALFLLFLFFYGGRQNHTSLGEMICDIVCGGCESYFIPKCILGLIIFCIYQIYFIASGQSTFGQSSCNLSVISINGDNLSYFMSFLRCILLLFLFPIIILTAPLFIMCKSFKKRHQLLHDILTNSIVINR